VKSGTLNHGDAPDADPENLQTPPATVSRWRRVGAVVAVTGLEPVTARV
jgi:hypothetical protein